MSFQGLISGSECALPANPLSQVLKHTEGDRSIQQDRVAGPSSRLHHIPRTAVNTASEHDLAQARQFFNNNTQPRNQDLSAFPPELHSGNHFPQPGPELSQAWRQNIPQSQGWAAEFERSASTGGISSPLSVNQNEAQQPTLPMSSMMMSRQPFYSGAPMYPIGLGAQPISDSKGKGKEIDFDAAFAQFNDTQSTSAHIEEVGDEVVQDPQVSNLAERFESNLGDPSFRQVWDQLQNSDVPPPQADMTKWEAEFQQLMASQRDELDEDYGAGMQSAWEGGLGNFNDRSSSNILQFDEDNYPIRGAYDFEKENKYMDPSSSAERSSLDAAKELLEQNGSLSEVALLLEAAIQKGDLGEGGYEAWILLGEVRNMDEREESGMKALLEGVKRAQNAGAAGEGMLSLAISFTNENYDRACHSTLLKWLKARFPSHPIPAGTEEAIKTHTSWDTHETITNIFIDLARSQHQQGVLDPDVQTGLGVLFYVNDEYDRAKDCFEAALSMRPQDYLLWNRLGSCLSNGNKAEEALGAYREALQLRPVYTRAIYNVGVACLNIGAFKEAAEHLLSAIAMQEATGAETSDQLWLTLRRTFVNMERHDLVNLTRPEARGTLDGFRKEGFDF